MAEVYVTGTDFESVPVLTCACGHRRPGGPSNIDAWFAHEESHVTGEHPKVGQFTTIATMPNPALLPPLTASIRYLA
jgi:hypothetical protein